MFESVVATSLKFCTLVSVAHKSAEQSLLLSFLPLVACLDPRFLCLFAAINANDPGDWTSYCVHMGSL